MLVFNSRSSLVILFLLVLLFASLASAQEPQNFPGAELANRRAPFRAAIAVNRADGRYQAGETLSLGFACDENAFLYLLYHQADGRSLLLFPNPAQGDNRVQARQAIKIPAPGAPFRIRIAEPFGQETLQVLASQAPLAELDRIAARPSPAPLVSQKTLAALGARIKQDPRIWAEHHAPIHTAPSNTAESAHAPVRVGLFIGVGKEQSEPEKGDEEMANSARLMREAMLKRGRLDPQRVRLLVDAQATKEAIKQAISQWLPSVTAPGDTVFIFYACHTAQIPKGEEPDQITEGFGVYDIDRGRQGMAYRERVARFYRSMIHDDELAEWLKALADRQVVLILDACFAGGAAEEKRLPRLKLLQNADDVTKDIRQLNTVVFASSAADEQSLFTDTPRKTMWFTHYLLEAIENTKGPLTIEQAHQYTRAGLRKLITQRRRQGLDPLVQEPTLIDRALLPIWLIP